MACILTEDQCNFIVHSLQSYFYVRMVNESDEYVWKKPEFITIREIFNIISDAIDELYNDNRDEYMG